MMRLRPLRKKASLSLSLEAIVIVVLAMTLLGLGLGFVRGLFKNITETTGQVSEQIQQQILDDLRTGNKRLSFPTTEIKVETSSSKVLAVGVKNVLDGELTFALGIQKGTTLENLDPSTQTGIGNFFWDKSEQTLKPGETRVFPLKYFAEKTSDSYLYKIVVVQDPDTSTPDLGLDNGATVYASKSFFSSVN